MKAYIYMLRDPRTGTPHYVGETTDPKRRYLQHTQANMAPSTNPYVYRWICSLDAPVIMDVVGVTHKRYARRLEHVWINRLESEGYKLLNKQRINKRGPLGRHAVACNEFCFIESSRNGKQVLVYGKKVTSTSSNKDDLIAQVTHAIDGLRDILDKISYSWDSLEHASNENYLLFP